MKIIFILSILLLIGSYGKSNLVRENSSAKKQYYLGLEYKNSENKNLRDAFKWMHRSAMKGYLPAQYEFALMFHYGMGVRQNFELARLWFNRASKQGDLRAKKVLYRFYAGEKVKSITRKQPRHYSQIFRTIRQ